MSGIYGVDSTTETQVTQVRANAFCHEAPVTVVSGSVLLRGMVMGQITESLNWVPLDVDAEDGSEIARGILNVREGTTLTNDTNLQMWMSGSFRGDDLEWPAGITDAQKAIAIQQLEDRGCVIV
jgi:hypothetical protein